MNKELFLGIDTSNYTTSFSLADSDGNIILNHKQLLTVKEGERGLRQSDAVFQHIKNTENAATALKNALIDVEGNICAVGVSATPTYANESYMPCFMAGLSLAQTVSAALRVPLYAFSHQAGHIMAAMHSARETALKDKEFIAFHISGGTTDIISVKPNYEKIIFPVTVGGTLDINAGQAIDRAGVMMGLSFPAGRELEKLALNYMGDIPRPLCCVNGLNCNLSGLENKANQLYDKSHDKALVSSYVISSVGVTLEKLLCNVYEAFGDLPIVFAGGVMSCSILQNMLKGNNRYFATPEYSSDNAAGIALLTYYKHVL